MALQAQTPTSTVPIRHRITVEEYERMIAANVWPEDERLELIEGELVRMSPINAPHAAAVKRLTELLRDRLGKRALVGVQDPIVLGDQSEAEPDISVLRRRADYYANAHPSPADVLLVVEVSDTTLEYDRDVKARLYARAGLPETWVVDLNGDRVIVFRDVDNGEYTRMESVRRGADMTPSAFPDVTLHVDDILGEGRASG
jgi:Uma2 family endonuclease